MNIKNLLGWNILVQSAFNQFNMIQQTVMNSAMQKLSNLKVHTCVQT